MIITIFTRVCRLLVVNAMDTIKKTDIFLFALIAGSLTLIHLTAIAVWVYQPMRQAIDTELWSNKTSILAFDEPLTGTTNSSANETIVDASSSSLIATAANVSILLATMTTTGRTPKASCIPLGSESRVCRHEIISKSGFFYHELTTGTKKCLIESHTKALHLHNLFLDCILRLNSKTRKIGRAHV